jgi:thiamine transporter ThiT
MNLVLAESIITIYGLPIDFLASYYFGWKMGKTLCLLSGVMLTISGKIYKNNVPGSTKSRI